jgi:hypothetical protein
MSPTVERIARFVVWSGLVVYGAAWVASLSAGFRSDLLPLAVPAAAGYVTAYSWRAVATGHCLQCAEPAALAGGVAGLILAALVRAAITGGLPEGVWIFPSGDGPPPGTVARVVVLAGLCGVGWIAGHILTLVYSVTVDACLRYLWRGKIAAERRSLDVAGALTRGEEA